MVGLMLPREERLAHFHWASTNRQQPCFCTVGISPVDLDVIKLHISKETIAAIFGVRKPENIQLYDKESGKLIPLCKGNTIIPGQDTGGWLVKPKRDYEVRIDCDNNNNKNNDENEEPVVPIYQIFPLFPGEDDDVKSGRIEKLSHNFYSKLWDDPETPAELRELFFSRTSSYKIQAFRQYDWFHETFGGPSLMEHLDREKHLWPKVMAKHTSSRMTREHAVAWLNIMNRALEEEFPHQYKLRSCLSLYWLHFYGFFPFTDDDRREFRRVVMKPLEEMRQKTGESLEE
jgi:truncated hemoglobin YjbI